VPSPGRPRRGAGDYRPDLRPMLLLAALLALVVLGWIVVSQLVLP
jgi:hypothetical protein